MHPAIRLEPQPSTGRATYIPGISLVAGILRRIRLPAPYQTEIHQLGDHSIDCKIRLPDTLDSADS